MVDFQNDVCEELRIEDFLEAYDFLSMSKDIELVIVDNNEIQKLNLEHRGIDKPTDVLSFPVEFEFADFLGSVVISYEMAKSVSNELGHSIQDEAKVLFIHGMLHLLGFDHELDSGEMRAKEQEVIEALGLPVSLIERNID